MKRGLGTALAALIGLIAAASIPRTIAEESRLVSDWTRQFVVPGEPVVSGQDWVYVRSGDRFAYVAASDGAAGYAAIRAAVHTADNLTFINQPASAERWALQSADGALLGTVARYGLPLIRSGRLTQYDDRSAMLVVDAIPPGHTSTTILLDERAVLVELVEQFALVAYLSGELRAYRLGGDGTAIASLRPAGPVPYALQALSQQQVAVVSGYPDAHLSLATLHDDALSLDWRVELAVTLDEPLQLIASGDRPIVALPDALFVSDGQTHERIAVPGLRQVSALAAGRHTVWEGRDGVSLRIAGDADAGGFDLSFAAAQIAGSTPDRVVLWAGGRLISVRWIEV